MAKIRIPEEQKQAVITIAAGILFLILGWMLAIQPFIRKLHGFEKMKADIRSRKEIISEMKDLKKQSEKLSESLFGAEDQHSILGKITSMTNQSGLQVLSMEPAEKIEDKFVREVVNLRVNANFKSLVRFFEKIESMRPTMVVTQLGMGQGQHSFGGSEASAAGFIETYIILEGLMKEGA